MSQGRAEGRSIVAVGIGGEWFMRSGAFARCEVELCAVLSRNANANAPAAMTVAIVVGIG